MMTCQSVVWTEPSAMNWKTQSMINDREKTYVLGIYNCNGPCASCIQPQSASSEASRHLLTHSRPLMGSSLSRGLSNILLHDNCTSVDRLSHQPHDARGVDDPASVAARMRCLVHKLGASVLASEKDAAAVDTHDTVPRLFRHLVHHAVVLGASYTGIVDYARSSRGFQSAIFQP